MIKVNENPTESFQHILKKNQATIMLLMELLSNSNRMKENKSMKIKINNKKKIRIQLKQQQMC